MIWLMTAGTIGMSYAWGMPVSYTHLDVYKRQSEGEARRRKWLALNRAVAEADGDFV